MVLRSDGYTIVGEGVDIVEIVWTWVGKEFRKRRLKGANVNV